MDFTFNIHFTMYIPSVPLFFYNGPHFAAMYIHLKKNNSNNWFFKQVVFFHMKVPVQVQYHHFYTVLRDDKQTEVLQIKQNHITVF